MKIKIVIFQGHFLHNLFPFSSRSSILVQSLSRAPKILSVYSGSAQLIILQAPWYPEGISHSCTYNWPSISSVHPNWIQHPPQGLVTFLVNSTAVKLTTLTTPRYPLVDQFPHACTYNWLPLSWVHPYWIQHLLEHLWYFWWIPLQCRWQIYTCR